MSALPVDIDAEVAAWRARDRRGDAFRMAKGMSALERRASVLTQQRMREWRASHPDWAGPLPDGVGEEIYAEALAEMATRVVETREAAAVRAPTVDASWPHLPPDAREWLARLAHAPKRAYAADYCAWLLDLGPEPADPGASWAAKARKRADWLLREACDAIAHGARWDGKEWQLADAYEAPADDLETF